MNKSVLGENLEFERDKVLFPKIGAIMKVPEKLSNEDRLLMDNLLERAADMQGHFSFQTDDKDFGRVTRIYDIISGNSSGPNEKEIEQLLVNAETIITKGLLTPGRRDLLDSYIDASANRGLTKGELDTIRFFVLEAFNHVNEK